MDEYNSYSGKKEHLEVGHLVFCQAWQNIQAFPIISRFVLLEDVISLREKAKIWLLNADVLQLFEKASQWRHTVHVESLGRPSCTFQHLQLWHAGMRTDAIVTSTDWDSCIMYTML